MVAKWSHISRILEEEFHIRGRNGKQCRLRYPSPHPGTKPTSAPPLLLRNGPPNRSND